MFSDVDIEKQIESQKKDPDTGISIEPFEKKYLTPVGYDLRVGKKGFSWNNKREENIERDGGIEIEPRDTVVIETLESQNRLFGMASFALVALAIGIVTSLINPVIGASLAAVIGGISPFVVEILKAK